MHVLLRDGALETGLTLEQNILQLRFGTRDHKHVTRTFIEMHRSVCGGNSRNLERYRNLPASLTVEVPTKGRAVP